MEGEIETKEIHLAGWDARFWAWLIDILLVGILWGAFTDLFVPFPYFGFEGCSASFCAVNVRPDDTFALFVYWTLMEGYYGQSVGKMALKLRVTGERGEKIGYAEAAIESLGKAFLLPIDVLIGWLIMGETRQRLFNRLSRTIVVRAREDGAPRGVKYVKD